MKKNRVRKSRDTAPLTPRCAGHRGKVRLPGVQDTAESEPLTVKAADHS